MFGERVFPDLTVQYYTSLLKNNALVSIQEAIFRNEQAFVPANLNKHKQFWDVVILKDHPHKSTLSRWLPGVEIDEFLNSYTIGSFQDIQIHSRLPQPAVFENYVPLQFTEFMNNTIAEWERLGVIERWEFYTKECSNDKPVVVCPLSVEPEKPRAIWDGRYLNEYIRDIPFTMDSVNKVAEIAWKGAYMFKLDHKNGYFHVPISRKSRKYFGIQWKGIYYVLCVLPFGWKTSPYIYHTLTEAVNMYIRSLGIPMLGWIDDMLGLLQQLLQFANEDQQYQSCERAIVVVTYVMFMAGYFLGKTKCVLQPTKVITYLGILCDTDQERFRVPDKRVHKYLPILYSLLDKSWLSYTILEKMVGKLVSLECAVLTGMWYTRELYAALKGSGTSPQDTKAKKNATYIKHTQQIKNELQMWIHLLLTNKGAAWRCYNTVLVEADISSDASGRQFAGVVDLYNGPALVTAGDFQPEVLQQDIQVKEGVALKETLAMLLHKFPDKIKGKTLVCKVDNMPLKAVLEREGTSANLYLNNVGKEIFWLQQQGDFNIAIKYIPSQENRADKYTRQSSGLEASLKHYVFMVIWEKWGPFIWDLMASAANVQKDPQGRRLKYFSRYYDSSTQGVDLFQQRPTHLTNIYCFPPIPIIGMVLKFLQQNRLNCVIILPAINASWVNLVATYMEDAICISEPFDHNVFEVLNNQGKYIRKKYPFAMLAVKINFSVPFQTLKYIFCN